jgi:hypothetical protein
MRLAMKYARLPPHISQARVGNMKKLPEGRMGVSAADKTNETIAPTMTATTTAPLPGRSLHKIAKANGSNR